MVGTARVRSIRSPGMPIVERPDMADYGVPEDPDGTLPWSWAEQRLVDNRNFWLVTASAVGRLHAMPVWGVWVPSTERFWFSCAPSSRKARNIAENPACVVTIDDTVECVSVEGRAHIVDLARDTGTAGGSATAIDAYVRKYWGDPEDHPDEVAFVGGGTVVEVTPERAFGLIEREEDFARRATRWRW